ncbi:MAG: FAD-dependent monooxygenase, partial [Pseudomonadota bacterium]
AGTGCDNGFTDGRQLCNTHIPEWFQTPGMSAAKISSFYNDPVKQDMENFSRQQAFFLRAITLNNGMEWKTRRLLRFGYHLARGFVHGFPFNNLARKDEKTKKKV